MTVQHTASGAGAPTSPPPSIGAHYTDTSTGDQYLSKGVLSVADWVLLGGAGGKKVVALVAGASTLTLAQANTFLAASEGGEVTIPLRSSVNFPIGTEIEIGQIGVNSVTLAASDGVELIYKDSTKLETNGRGTMIRLKQVASDVWLVSGDLVPEVYLAAITWERIGPISGVMQFVSAPVGLGIAVVGGDQGSSLWWTEDGVTYTSGMAGVTVKGLVYSDSLGKFFALVGPEGAEGSGFRILSSESGKAWDVAAVVDDDAPGVEANGLAYSDSLAKLVVCGFKGAPAFWSSSDGSVWTQAADLPGGPPAWGLFFSEVGGKFIALAGSPTLGTLESLDGSTWTAGVTDVGIGYSGKTRFAEDPIAGAIVVTTGANQYARSMDGGQTWATKGISLSGISSLSVNNFAWAPGMGVLLASSSSHSRILFSRDGGESWVETTPVDSNSNYNNWVGEFTDQGLCLAFAAGVTFTGIPQYLPVG